MDESVAPHSSSRTSVNTQCELRSCHFHASAAEAASASALEPNFHWKIQILKLLLRVNAKALVSLCLEMEIIPS